MPLLARGIRSSFAYAAAGCLVVIALLLTQQASVAASPAVVLLIFTASLLAAAAAWQSTRETVRANALAQDIERDAHRRDTLLQLGARALTGGSLEAVSRDVATVTAATLGVEHCVVFELPPRGGSSLVLSTASGWNDSTVDGLTISRNVDTQAGYALYANEPVIVADTDSDRRFSLPAALRSRGVRSGAAARIGTAGRPWGVLAAYSALPRSYSDEDAQFISGAATVLSGGYERRRLDAERTELAARDRVHRGAADLASRRAAFLAQTATVFDAALEPETTLINLARIAVPALADCAVVDVVHEDGQARRVDVVDIDPTRRDAAHAIGQQTPNLRDQSPMSRAIRTGQAALLAARPEECLEDGSHDRLLDMLQCQTLLLVPLVARGQTLGLLTFGSRERRYDGGDLAVAQELAGRAAMAVDNARLYREARSASRAKDDFLAMISHELRTPINAVLGWATMLRDHRLDAARVEYAYEALERNARAQAHLLEQLLDVSRAIAGKLELRFGAAHLDAIIDAALAAVQIDAQQKTVRITAQLDRSVPLILVDAARLQQVIINVIANAVKFSPEGGEVHAILQQDADVAEIVVRDDGIGIKREFLPYVFERFRQGGLTSGALNRGLGLGMSIARDIVERHGGTITADSEGEGKGAKFVVRLPIRVAMEASMAAAGEFTRRGPVGPHLFEDPTNS